MIRSFLPQFKLGTAPRSYKVCSGHPPLAFSNSPPIIEHHRWRPRCHPDSHLFVWGGVRALVTPLEETHLKGTLLEIWPEKVQSEGLVAVKVEILLPSPSLFPRRAFALPRQKVSATRQPTEGIMSPWTSRQARPRCATHRYLPTHISWTGSFRFLRWALARKEWPRDIGSWSDYTRAGLTRGGTSTFSTHPSLHQSW